MRLYEEDGKVVVDFEHLEVVVEKLPFTLSEIFNPDVVKRLEHGVFLTHGDSVVSTALSEYKGNTWITNLRCASTEKTQ